MGVNVRVTGPNGEHLGSWHTTDQGEHIPMPTYYEMIRIFDKHLDDGVADEYKSQPLAQDWARVCKVAEELGEAISDLIAYTGQNPRKGVHGDQLDMLKELADVANTAILCIQHFTKDDTYTSIIVHEKLQECCRRVGIL